jgi:uncharacterized protein YceH (UPF0502 family)
MMTLNAMQARVLGALMEKEITTPEAYPLSLNALGNACNQKSSREPVMELSEEEVRQALHGLEELELVTAVRDARVAKYEHRVRTVLNLRRDETAILCLLLLRGPQTVGELRSRSDRLYSFDDLEAVESTLNRLARRGAEGDAASPLAVLLPRQPGSREARWVQLLGGPVDMSAVRPEATPSARVTAGSEAIERIAVLEADVASLREAVASLEQRLRVVGA